MLGPRGFANWLSSRLVPGNKVRIYHVSTPPAPSAPLFVPGPGRSEEPTTLESHFLGLSQLLGQEKKVTVSDAHDVLVLGIEVLIFTTDKLTTVFVSKADSTGLLQKNVRAASDRTSLIQTVITAFLEYLLKTHVGRNKVVLSLFARSQNQYLFPGSIENVTKHVLDDRQLIKWWCRVLDPVARQFENHASLSVKAHVVVPGCDDGETKVFFPPSARSDPATKSLWRSAYPVDLLVEDTLLPPRCLIPRLPDDPKSRFLEDLDTHRDKDGIWRGIKSLSQFWEMMSYRQECSAGRLVGFIWIVFTPVNLSKERVGDASLLRQKIDHQPHPRIQESASGPLSTAATPVPAAAAASVTPVTIESPSAVLASDAVNSSSGQSFLKETTSGKSHSEHDSRINGEGETSTANLTTTSASWPDGHVELTPNNYEVLMSFLLELDFGGKEVAVVSSKKWHEKAKELAGVSDFGVEAEGVAAQAESPATTPATTQVSVQTNVNILTNVRKKRKAEQTGTSSTGDVSQALTKINTLSTNLVRKKPKA